MAGPRGGTLPTRRTLLGVGSAIAVMPRRLSAQARAFPLRIAPDGRRLVDSTGRPFLIHGDTAWSLMAQLRFEDAESYLQRRSEQHFNTLLVNLIEHKFASRAPLNAYGEAPFLQAGDFAAPNEAYFSHVDRILLRARALGFLVLLAPAYLGYGGGDEGWYQAMVAAGEGRLLRYGEFVGRRYGGMDNVIWVHGGDYDPPRRSIVEAVVEGIRKQAPNALHTAHGAPETDPAVFWNGVSWLDLDALYTYRPVHAAALRAETRRPRRPFLLIESAYENEQETRPDRLRTQAYQALLGGACGQVFGNNPIWHFGAPNARTAPVTWRQALDGPGSRSMAHLVSFFTGISWAQLVPIATDSMLAEAPPQSSGHIAAAMTSDRRTALLHFSEIAPFRVVTERLQGRRRSARWYDPANGTYRPAIEWGDSGGRYELPGTNAGGATDWILDIRSHD
jgi:hypothetical protein